MAGAINTLGNVRPDHWQSALEPHAEFGLSGNRRHAAALHIEPSSKTERPASPAGQIDTARQRSRMGDRPRRQRRAQIKANMGLDDPAIVDSEAIAQLCARTCLQLFQKPRLDGGKRARAVRRDIALRLLPQIEERDIG
ncbi:hypothetical protein D9M69_651300 [compost metagenome]